MKVVNKVSITAANLRKIFINVLLQKSDKGVF